MLAPGRRAWAEGAVCGGGATFLRGVVPEFVRKSQGLATLTGYVVAVLTQKIQKSALQSANGDARCDLGGSNYRLTRFASKAGADGTRASR